MATKKNEQEPTGSWVIQGIPRDLMKQFKMAAVIADTSVKQLLIDLATEHVKVLEKKGVLPKGK